MVFPICRARQNKTGRGRKIIIKKEIICGLIMKIEEPFKHKNWSETWELLQSVIKLYSGHILYFTLTTRIEDSLHCNNLLKIIVGTLENIALMLVTSGVWTLIIQDTVSGP